MSERLPVFYWDTCIFYEHLRDEPVAPAKKRAVLRILQSNKEKQNRIITSALTHAEALPRKLNEFDAAKEVQYWSYFNGIYFADHEISRPVIGLARDIRDFYYKEADPKSGEPHRCLGLADAVHLATAIIARVDEFHTRDRRGRGGNIGLLGIRKLTENGKIAGRWVLKIVDPEDPQGDILDNLPRSERN